MSRFFLTCRRCFSVITVPQSSLFSTLLENTTRLRELNQIYANILITNFLETNSASFNWNNIIRSYTRLEAPRNAIRVYISMLQAGVLPDRYTLPIVLKAVSQTFATELGKQVHSAGIKLGLQSNEGMDFNRMESPWLA
ncbi:hypothetical protein TSUD_74640 [Trifolium subterraneum]|nr:hypothetical protein TSUD_74640 [Trifolium subterraneum]